MCDVLEIDIWTKITSVDTYLLRRIQLLAVEVWIVYQIYLKVLKDLSIYC